MVYDLTYNLNKIHILKINTVYMNTYNYTEDVFKGKLKIIIHLGQYMKSWC